MYRESKPSINIFNTLHIQSKFCLLYFLFAVGLRLVFAKRNTKPTQKPFCVVWMRSIAAMGWKEMESEPMSFYFTTAFDRVVNVRFMWFHGMYFSLVCFIRCFVFQTTNIRHCFCIGVRSSMFAFLCGHSVG